MPLSPSLHDEQVTGNWLKSKWLTNTKTRFFELGKIAFECPPLSRTFCLAGVNPENVYQVTYDPEDVYQVTYSSDSELHKILHAIYVDHGAVNLQFRGCDEVGSYYLRCSQPGRKHDTKAVIRVSPAKVEKGRAAVANTEPSQPAVDGQVQDQEDWQDVLRDEVEEEDDWVKV